MYRVNRKLRAGGMAYVATFSQYIGIGQEVGRFALRNMTSAASRRSGLHGVSGRPLNPALRILHRVQADGQILLAAISVADGAVLHIGGVSRRTHDREECTGEVVMASAKADDNVRILGRPAGVDCGIHSVVNAVH